MKLIDYGDYSILAVREDGSVMEFPSWNEPELIGSFLVIVLSWSLLDVARRWHWANQERSICGEPGQVREMKAAKNPA